MHPGKMGNEEAWQVIGSISASAGAPAAEMSKEREMGG